MKDKKNQHPLNCLRACQFMIICSMFDRMSNVDTDAEVRTKAKNHILREACKNYKETKSPEFTQEKIHKELEGWFPDYLDINIRELFRGSGLVEIDVNDNLTLNAEGRRACKKGYLFD
jgi:hypothetical protein